MGTIGIDAIAIAVPRGFVEMTDLARARGVPAGKYVEGLGVSRMAVADAHEDAVALGANASRRLFATAGVEASSIGLCVAGTETGVDHSKPIAAYLHRFLGLPQRCRVYETKHACFGGTAALLGAIDWIAAGSNRGRNALIVCTDIARYALNSPGEPTQGAGAVALLVTENPRLLAFEPGISGSYARDVDDFWRPLYSKVAVVDGHLSVQCYLDALAGAYDAYCEAATLAGYDARTLARRCYHVPYGKMAKKAHRHLKQREGCSEAEADASYQVEVASSLALPSQVGNIYTGSLYLALASLLDAEAEAIEGERVGLFSYGSGCCAEYFAGRVEKGAGEWVRRLALAQPLAERRTYSIEEYEAIRAGDDAVDQAPVHTLNGHSPAGMIAFVGVDNQRRVYE